MAAAFGVPDEQVRRDHLISHLLAALTRLEPDEFVFFGGTALARTHLVDGRLSEDIDLYALRSRSSVVADVERAMAEGVRRSYGLLSWLPMLSQVREVDSAVLSTANGLTVRVQLLDSVGYPTWPTERRHLFQRYADAPSATLRVPTLAAFVAAKTTAWLDRGTPRDLYDLWGLARVGAINAEAADLFATLGPTGHPPHAWMFTKPSTPSDWNAQLGGQTRLAIGPADALSIVAESWAAATAR